MCSSRHDSADLEYFWWLRGETGPRPVEWHLTVTVSTRTGVRPSRGRPPEQQRYSAVSQAGHVDTCEDQANRSTHQTARPLRDAVRPEPGTARQRNRFCFATAFCGTRGVRFCAQQETNTPVPLEPILQVPAMTLLACPMVVAFAERGRRSGAPDRAARCIARRTPCPGVPIAASTERDAHLVRGPHRTLTRGRQHS
jgi:hypothetical protein